MFKNLFNTFSSETLKNKDINIIVCEDDEITQVLLVKTLKNLGIKSVAFFETAEKLKDHIRNLKKIDKNTVIILDIKMPQDTIQGDELCKKLREEGINCSIIASTGLKTRSDSLQMFMDDGFSDILIKPYTRNELIEVLDRCSEDFK